MLLSASPNPMAILFLLNRTIPSFLKTFFDSFDTFFFSTCFPNKKDFSPSVFRKAEKRPLYFNSMFRRGIKNFSFLECEKRPTQIPNEPILFFEKLNILEYKDKEEKNILFFWILNTRKEKKFIFRKLTSFFPLNLTNFDNKIRASSVLSSLIKTKHLRV